MSSMWRAAVILPVLLAITPASSAQYAAPATSCASYAPSSTSYRVGARRRGVSYARAAATGSPNMPVPDRQPRLAGRVRMRGWAEKAMRPGENPDLRPCLLHQR